MNIFEEYPSGTTYRTAGQLPLDSWYLKELASKRVNRAEAESLQRTSRGPMIGMDRTRSRDSSGEGAGEIEMNYATGM